MTYGGQKEASEKKEGEDAQKSKASVANVEQEAGDAGCSKQEGPVEQGSLPQEQKTINSRTGPRRPAVDPKTFLKKEGGTGASRLAGSLLAPMEWVSQSITKAR